MSLNLRDAIITSIWKLKLFSRDIFLLSFASRGEKLISAFVSWSNCDKKKTRCKLLPFSQTWISPSLKSEKKFLARFYKAFIWYISPRSCSLFFKPCKERVAEKKTLSVSNEKQTATPSIQFRRSFFSFQNDLLFWQQFYKKRKIEFLIVLFSTCSDF